MSNQPQGSNIKEVSQKAGESFELFFNVMQSRVQESLLPLNEEIKQLRSNLTNYINEVAAMKKKLSESDNGVTQKIDVIEKNLLVTTGNIESRMQKIDTDTKQEKENFSKRISDIEAMVNKKIAKQDDKFFRASTIFAEKQ